MGTEKKARINLLSGRARAGAALLSLTLLACSALTFGQTQSGISGSVLDQTGAGVPNAKVTATSEDTGVLVTTTSNSKGLYSFPSLTPGYYDIQISAPGFETFSDRHLQLQLGQLGRLDASLTVGSVDVQVVVNADESPLQTDTVTMQTDISPEVENSLPILVSGAPRAATTFTALMPGVAAAGGTSGVESETINGGQSVGQEAILDSISMQEGGESQGGNIAFFDFPMSPDVVSEVKVLASNYDPQYGSTTSGVIVVDTKSGTKQFKGNLYEYLRNTDLNAKQFGAVRRPVDIENDFGGSLGGPIRIPGVHLIANKAYFFFNYEGFRQTGGVTTPVLSIPSLQDRAGDFTDQVNSATGQLIPIYDPATTTVDASGNVTRKQFMGCDGNQPNVICQDRIASSLANSFLSYLPTPTNNQPFNNYLAPKAIPSSLGAHVNQYFVRIDDYLRDNDSIAGVYWHQSSPPIAGSYFPIPISYNTLQGNPENSTIMRFNWAHTISNTKLNHLAFGYLNRHEATASLNTAYTSQLPQIPGVAAYATPPEISLDQYGSNGAGLQMGNTVGAPGTYASTRPTYIVNDLFTVVIGRHTLSAGGEYRYLAATQSSVSNEAGTFEFGTGQTGLRNQTSGNATASFLLGAVETGSTTFYSVDKTHSRQNAFALYVNDHWKATDKLSLQYGLRWNFWGAGFDADNQRSWIDLARPNSDAAQLPGSLVFASSNAGSSYAGKRSPENPYYGGFDPRVGLIYSFDPKTLVRSGFAILHDQLFYNDYSLGAQLTGYNAPISKAATGNGGLDPAFYLAEGIPGGAPTTPNFDGGSLNGQDTARNGSVRAPFGARTPYAEQWILSIERQVGKGGQASVAYVGNKGTHLNSRLNPYNYAPLQDLALGNKLYDTFQPGESALDGVNAPYAGWQQQMKGCSPTVAQALMPFPQYCSALYLLTETEGYSNYNSLQLAYQQRYANGFFFLTNFTWSRTFGTVTNEFARAATGVASQPFAPGQAQRNYAPSALDIPIVYNLATLYTLPFGHGKRFLSNNNILDRFVGGWELSGIYHFNSGTPISITASCELPSQFQALGCYPNVLQKSAVLAHSQAQLNSSIANGSPVSAFNAKAFEGANFPTPFQYNLTIPTGPLFPGVRGFRYTDLDLSLMKTTHIAERLSLKLGVQAFNSLNQHSLGSNFGTGLTSANFGIWTGTTTNPRNVQVSGRLEF
jgi:hypothetical protein